MSYKCQHCGSTAGTVAWKCRSCGAYNFPIKTTCEDPGFLPTRTETTRPNPSLSPTCAAAMIVGLGEVKKLLLDLLPVVEGVAKVDDLDVFECPFCQTDMLMSFQPHKHYDNCLGLVAQSVLPRLLRAIKELSP